MKFEMPEDQHDKRLMEKIEGMSPEAAELARRLLDPNVPFDEVVTGVGAFNQGRELKGPYTKDSILVVENGRTIAFQWDQEGNVTLGYSKGHNE